MNETAQIIIVAVITILTIVLSLVGIQIIFVLRELKQSLTRVNTILGDANRLTNKISHSTDSLSGLFVGLKTAFSLLGAFKKKQHDG